MNFYNIENGCQVVLTVDSYNDMIRYCKDAGDFETGGILIGYYKSSACAVISCVTQAPIDSKKYKTRFSRGVVGLKALLSKYWKNNMYYIGEWHYHPYSRPFPSSIDIKQMFEFSKDKNLKCPEPIMVIVGMKDLNNYEPYVAVFKNNKMIELNKD